MTVYGKIQFLGLVVFASVLCAADVTMAQGRGGGFGRGGGIMDYVENEAVVKEVEINDEQKSDISGIRQDTDTDRRDMFMGMRDKFRDPDVDRGELMAEMRDEMKLINDSAEEALAKVLLPHQLARLKEIALQQSMKRNPESALQQLMEEIDATEEQIAGFKKAMEEGNAEFQEKVAKLRQQLLDKSLKSAFRPEQVSKLKVKLGDSFNMPQQTQNFRGGQRGGQQQQRGDQQQRGGDQQRGGGDRGDKNGRGNDF